MTTKRGSRVNGPRSENAAGERPHYSDYSTHHETENAMNIDKAVQRYNKLASRRDGRINVPALNEIAAQLATVPPGQRNDVDLLLGRPAELPERAEYQMRPATDTAAATEAIAELAQKKQDEFLTHIADQYADMLDWHRLCGDLAI